MPHPTPFQSEAEAIVAAQVAHNAAIPPVGVCWSGLTTSRYVEVEDVEVVRARLQAFHEAREAFRKAPGGRFLAAVGALEELGYGAETYRLRAMWGSTISEGSALCEEDRIAAIGRAITLLNGIGHSDARLAINALADMLAPVAAQVRKAA